MREVNEMINDINLTDKTNTQSSKLSGGMKRKLRYDVMAFFNSSFRLIYIMTLNWKNTDKSMSNLTAINIEIK